MKQSINFVVHKGKLESQALLLAASIKYFNADKYILNACIPIHLGGITTGISTFTKARLIELGVKLIEINNPIDPNYLIGNKFLCLDRHNTENRVFLDTDIICCGTLNFPLLDPNTIAVKPADRKTYAWNKSTWKKGYLKYSKYKLNSNDLVFSTAFNEPMLPYFNAGVIAINGCMNFSQEWASLAKTLDDDTGFSGKRPWLDQLALPLTIKKLGLDLHCLTEQLNFPANIKPLKDNIILVHYHQPKFIARNPKLMNTIRLIVNSFPWIKQAFLDSEWKSVKTLLELTGSSSHSRPTNIDIIIASFTLEDSKILYKQLEKQKENYVSFNPIQITRPLLKRYIPWGVASYFNDVKRDNLLNLNSSASTVIAMGTIDYITSFARVLMVKPQVTLLTVFNSPIETISTWNQQPLNKILPFGDKIFNHNIKWLDESDKYLLSLIKKQKEPILVQALSWNFLALQLLKFKHKVKIIEYIDLISNEIIFSRFFQTESKPPIKLKTSIKIEHTLTASEVKHINNTSNQLYNELKLYKEKP